MSYLTPKVRDYLSDHYDEMYEQFKKILEQTKYNYPRAYAEFRKLHPQIKLTSYAIGEFITAADLAPFQLKSQIEPYKQANRYFKSLEEEVLQFMNETLIQSKFKHIAVIDLWNAYERWAVQEMGSVCTVYTKFLNAIKENINRMKFDTVIEMYDQRWTLIHVDYKIFDK